MTLRALGAVLLVALAGTAADDGGDRARAPATTEASSPPPTASDGSGRRGAPPEVAEHADDWPLANRDYASTRAVLDGPIDASSVARLEEAWRYELPGSSTFGNAATNPLVLGDTVYVGDLTMAVHALDRRTGERRWSAGGGGSMFGPVGVAVGWGKVFGVGPGATRRGALVVAYDARTGEERWATDITRNGGEVNVQPSAYAGLVFASTSGFGLGARGTIWALDQATGAPVWTFDTIASDDLWGNPDVNSGGGTWYPPAVAADLGLAYFGVGNPYPFPGAPGFPNGSSRPGDNRWTDSTVALDVETGALRWGFQAFPHDLFDRDHVLAGLADLGGGERVLVSTGKGGVVFGLDPATGEERWSVEVGVHDHDGRTALDGPLEVMPGAQGGVLTPLAIADGTVYVAVVNAPTRYEGPEESSTGFGTRLGVRPSDVVAIDAATGEIRWDVEVDGDALGGVTVVNDLVFTATLGGEILALDRATGDEVWSMRADGGINGWPAVVDDLVVWPVGFATPAHLLALRLP